MKREVTGDPDPKTYKHVICRAPEPNNADAHAPLYSAYKRFQQKSRKSRVRGRLHSMYYNFVRLHQTLKTSPAMAAGVTDRLWEMTDVVDMLDAFEAKRKREPKVTFEVIEWKIGGGCMCA